MLQGLSKGQQSALGSARCDPVALHQLPCVYSELCGYVARSADNQIGLDLYCIAYPCDAWSMYN